MAEKNSEHVSRAYRAVTNEAIRRAEAAQARIAELEAKLAEAHGALEKMFNALNSNAPEGPQKEIYDGVVYRLDGQAMYHAINACRAALASGGTEAAAVLEAAVAIADRLVECAEIDGPVFGWIEEDWRAATKLKDAVDAYLTKRGRT